MRRIKEDVIMNVLKKALHLPVIYIFIFAAILYSFYWNSTFDKACNELGQSAQECGEIDMGSQDFSKDTKLEKTEITGKRRVNVLLLGIESNERADTIMFLSYDSVKGNLSIVSIPRDTYFFEAGYNKGDQRKINAVFGRKQEEGCAAAVSKLLCDTPVDYYMSIDYKGVRKLLML